MAAHVKHGDVVRLRVRMFPTEIVVESAIKTITIEPFWMLVFFAECHSIHDVKNKILSTLNMRAGKIKMIADKLKNSENGNLSLSIESDTEDEIVVKTASQQNPKSDKNQSSSITPHPGTGKPEIIRFESCRLSMDNCILPSSERSEILKDDDLVCVKVTGCKLCEQESLHCDKNQQKILKLRKCLSKSNELLQNVVSADNFFSKNSLTNFDSVSLDTVDTSDTRSKKRKRPLPHGIDTSLINIDEQRSNDTEKGASKYENITASSFKDATEESKETKSKQSKKRKRRKPSTEQPIGDNLDQCNLDKDVHSIDKDSASCHENEISNNIINTRKGFIPETENGGTRIINDSKESDEPNEMETECAFETIDKAKERDLPDTEINASSYLEQLLKKRAEELSARNNISISDTLNENTTDQPKRKRNRKRKKKAASVQPVETAVTNSDYSFRLPPHLMPQNSRLTFNPEEETEALEENNGASVIDRPMIMREEKNSEKIAVKQKILTPFLLTHSKPAEQYHVSGNENSETYGTGTKPGNETESTVLPCSSGDRNLQNNVGSTPGKPGLSDANLRRATVNFIERAQMTPLTDDTQKIQNASIPLGTPIDPNDKFQQLLKQRSFSGRQLEISKSVAGHSLCVSQRKKRDKSLNASLPYAADPETDVLTNISTIQQASTDQPSLAKRQSTEVGQSTDFNKVTVHQTLPSQSFKAADVKKEVTGSPFKAGDILVFKVLELSEDYTPTLSEFKEARVLFVNSESSSVQVELKGERMRQKRQGRFELDYGEDEDDGELEQDSIVTYDISELLEMQVISGAEYATSRKRVSSLLNG